MDYGRIHWRKLKQEFDKLLSEVLKALQLYYSERLVMLAIFGSVARGTRPDSYLDLLLVCDPLPAGRMRRVAEFRKVEEQLEPLLASLQKMGITTTLSVIVKTLAEVQRGGLFYLDFIENTRSFMIREISFVSF